MTLLSDFYGSLFELVKSYQKKNLALKVEQDLETDIIRILGKNITTLSRAKSGIEEVIELAETSAEHHPYWGLLYNSSQISRTSLEKWDNQLTKDEIKEIEWSLDELKNTCKKLKESID